MNKTIEVVITPTGSVKINGIGFKGADCEKATAFLEAALGIEQNRVRKPEFHQQARKHLQQKLGS
jgi:Protein of unknown function (DUF2997)